MAPIVLAFVLAMASPQDATDVSGLFKGLRSSATAPQQVIRLYATDDRNMMMCFISNEVIHIYSNGVTTLPLYAKMFNVKAVNRITYRKDDVGGSFLVWIDDEVVLSIGASPTSDELKQRLAPGLPYSR